MDKKAFSPYFLSNSTLLDFDRSHDKSLISLTDIMQTFDRQNKDQAKYYFKFDSLKLREEILPSMSNLRNLSQFSSTRLIKGSGKHLVDLHKNRVEYFSV